nr:MAG: polyprotein P2a [Sobemovirus sp.]
MYHTFMAALLNLLSLVSMVILLDCYLGNCNVGVPGVAIALGVISITVMFWLVTLVIYLLELRRYKAVEEKIIRRTHLELIGLPTFDPNKGIVGRASNAVGDEFEVLINPNWWQFIWSGHEAKQVDDNECAVLGSPYVKVQPGGEPKSYVLLKLHGQVIGAGSRVVIDGVDYLLTAYHVWDREPDALSKNGKEVSLPKVEATYYSSDKDMDFSLVQLPLGIWSNLGVQSARVKPLSTRASVTLYGGSASQELISSFGRATCVDGVNIHHHASTNRAWSGSPLYDSRNCVVGVHLGFGELGQYNRASNIGFIARILSSQETMPPDLNFVEITEDELYDRPYDFNTYTIHGFSDVKIKNREYYIPKGKDWSTYAEDDDDEFFDTPVDVFLSTNETSELSLNSTGAAKPPRLPPLLNSGITPGKAEVSSLRESDYSLLVQRLVCLEKALEKLTQHVLTPPENISQSSDSLDGQREGQKQSCVPCSCRRDGLKLPTPQLNSEKPVKKSQSGIPNPGPGNVSEVQSGPGALSKKKSGKLRRRGKKSKETQAQAAH